MAIEIVHFLMGKFTDSLQGEDATEVLFEQRFRELKWELEKRISSDMPLDTTNLLRELLYDLNDILAECRTPSRRHSDRRRHSECIACCFLRDLWFCYRTKKRLLKIMQSIRTISTNEIGGETAIDVNIIPRREIGKGKAMEFDRWTSPTVNVSKVYGFSDQALEMEKLLIKKLGGTGFTAVGIAGMGGVGKTTLAQVVFNSPNVRRYFYPRLWVCMSQTSESGKDARKEAVERALMSLGVEEEVIRSAVGDLSGSQSLAALTFMLHLQLLGKRYLIVFDDLWSTDEWYERLDVRGSPGDDQWGDRLAYGLPKGGGGGVIVTGRMEAAVKRMVGEGDTRLLMPLEGREACWSIFMDAFVKAGRSVDHAALRDMEAEITDKCCGLPLAARTIGEIMSEMMSSSSGSTCSRGWSSSNVSSSTNSGSLV